MVKQEVQDTEMGEYYRRPDRNHKEQYDQDYQDYQNYQNYRNYQNDQNHYECGDSCSMSCEEDVIEDDQPQRTSSNRHSRISKRERPHSSRHVGEAGSRSPSPMSEDDAQAPSHPRERHHAHREHRRAREPEFDDGPARVPVYHESTTASKKNSSSSTDAPPSKKRAVAPVPRFTAEELGGADNKIVGLVPTLEGAVQESTLKRFSDITNAIPLIDAHPILSTVLTHNARWDATTSKEANALATLAYVTVRDQTWPEKSARPGILLRLVGCYCELPPSPNDDGSDYVPAATASPTFAATHYVESRPIRIASALHQRNSSKTVEQYLEIITPALATAEAIIKRIFTFTVVPALGYIYTAPTGASEKKLLKTKKDCYHEFDARHVIFAGFHAFPAPVAWGHLTGKGEAAEMRVVRLAGRPKSPTHLSSVTLDHVLFNVTKDLTKLLAKYDDNMVKAIAADPWLHRIWADGTVVSGTSSAVVKDESVRNRNSESSDSGESEEEGEEEDEEDEEDGDETTHKAFLLRGKEDDTDNNNNVAYIDTLPGQTGQTDGAPPHSATGEYKLEPTDD